MIRLKYLIILCLFANQLLSQEITTDSLFKLARLNFAPDLTKTNLYLDSVVTIAANRKDTITLVNALFVKGGCAHYFRKFEDVYDNYSQAEFLINTVSSSVAKDSFKIEINYALGKYFFDIDDQIRAAKYFTNNINFVSNKKLRTTSDTNRLRQAYQFISTIAELKGNYGEALKYLNYDIEILTKRHQNKNHPEVNKKVCNLATFQTRNKHYKTAISNFEICIPAIQNEFENEEEFPESFGRFLSIIYKDFGTCQLNLSNIDSALILLNKSLTYPTTGEDYIAISELSLGEVHAKLNQHQKANKYFKSALQKMNDFHKTKHPEIAKMHLAIGNHYLKNNDHEAALDQFQQALIQLIHNFNLDEYYANPLASDLFINDDLIKTLSLKTVALNALSNIKQDASLKILAYETGKLGIQQMTKAISESTRNETDIIGIVNRNYGLYEEILSLAYDLGIGTTDEFFNLIESSKSASLLKTFKHKNETNLAKIPQVLSNAYHVAKLKLTQKENEKYEMETSAKIDTIALATIGNEIFELEREIECLKYEIGTYLPQQNKNNTNIRVETIQSNLLNANETIVEYFIGQENSFVLIIKKDTVHFEKLNLTNEDLIAAGNLKEKIFGGANESFIPDAHRLYDVLLKPIKEKYGLTKKLIIIPDGPLYYLPFEVLLTGPVNNPKEFGEFPYLIQDHTISYCFSSSMLENLEGKTHIQTPVSEVLAFGPSFTNTASAGRSVASVRGDLNDLDYNKDEIEYIKEWFYCKSLVDTLANKQTFLNLARNYRFIHLATHAKVDDKNPDFSFIAFTNGIDTIILSDPEFKLTINELSTLNLNADMVVLSACETGVGKVYKGEGIISISRGFIETGAKSIVTTLWNIDDQLSSKLMDKFYKHLSLENKSKDEALCDAKREYLLDNDAFQAHPKYWAAFVPYGDMSPVETRSYFSIWQGGLWTLLLFFLYRGRQFFVIGKNGSD